MALGRKSYRHLNRRNERNKTQTVRFYEPVKYNLEEDQCTNTACRVGDKTVFACLANNS